MSGIRIQLQALAVTHGYTVACMAWQVSCFASVGCDQLFLFKTHQASLGILDFGNREKKKNLRKKNCMVPGRGGGLKGAAPLLGTDSQVHCSNIYTEPPLNWAPECLMYSTTTLKTIEIHGEAPFSKFLAMGRYPAVHVILCHFPVTDTSSGRSRKFARGFRITLRLKIVQSQTAALECSSSLVQKHTCLGKLLPWIALHTVSNRAAYTIPIQGRRSSQSKGVSMKPAFYQNHAQTCAWSSGSKKFTRVTALKGNIGPPNLKPWLLPCFCLNRVQENSSHGVYHR